MRKPRFAILVILLVGNLFFPYGMAMAQESALPEGFDPNAILSDDDIFNAQGLSFERIVSFLRSKGTLAEYRTADIDGIPKTAPEIIWRVAQSYKINPKYLLSLLQKEQSLVEDRHPSQNQLDWATGYAICDSCSKNDPSLQEFKGFASQLEWAAKQHREKYLMQLLSRGKTIGGKGVGTPVVIDGKTITPANHATAMLYTYTPHIHGNLNLWRIWRRWFSVTYPDGTVVRVGPKGAVYLLRFGEKRPFTSRAVVASLVDESKIVQVTEGDLANYPDGTPIKFPKYALIRVPDGKIYLLTSDAKRHIANLAAFKKFGFNSDEIIEAEHEDLIGYDSGPSITVETTFPQGTLMKTAAAPGVWYVEDGKRRPLIDRVLLTLYFRGRQIRTVTETALEQYDVDRPYTLHNGELVKSSSAPAVYVVEEGRLRPIPSGEIFEHVGWKWKNIVNVPERVLALHEIGEPFDPSSTKATEQLTGSSL